jgi:transposase
MGRRSHLSLEQRTEAVLALFRREEPVSKLARRYGVSEKTLYSWRDDFIAGGKHQLKDKSGGTKDEERKLKKLERKIEKREQVIGELTIANMILKKIADDSGLPPASEEL